MVREEIIKHMKDGNYRHTIYKVLSTMLPSNIGLKESDLDSDRKVIKLLSDVYKLIQKLQLSNPIGKAINMITISVSLNNIVSENFTPQYLSNVRESVSMQQISFAYLKLAMDILQSNSCELYFEDVNDLNYYMCVIESNMIITLLSDKGNIYLGKEELNNQIRSVINRVNKLISKDPKHEYYRLQSLLYHHLGMPQKAMAISKMGYVNTTSSINLTNINSFHYKVKLSGKKCPVEIYR